MQQSALCEVVAAARRTLVRSARTHRPFASHAMLLLLPVVSDSVQAHGVFSYMSLAETTRHIFLMHLALNCTPSCSYHQLIPTYTFVPIIVIGLHPNVTNENSSIWGKEGYK